MELEIGVDGVVERRCPPTRPTARIAAPSCASRTTRTTAGTRSRRGTAAVADAPRRVRRGGSPPDRRTRPRRALPAGGGSHAPTAGRTTASPRRCTCTCRPTGCTRCRCWWQHEDRRRRRNGRRRSHDEERLRGRRLARDAVGPQADLVEARTAKPDRRRSRTRPASRTRWQRHRPVRVLADANPVASPHLDPFTTHPASPSRSRWAPTTAPEFDGVAGPVALPIGVPLDRRATS